MPSFDIVSEIDLHEVTNAVDQANKEVATRFDFKGTDSKYELTDNIVTLNTKEEFQLGQMMDVLSKKLSTRKVDVRCMDKDEPELSSNTARQKVTLRHGIETELAKKMVKMIKDTKLKVQASIQEKQVRVNGKKRDDLQAVMAMLKDSNLEIPLQFINFRD
ncbi:MAG TPA: YajQ family cyclic di-GMP-binding protein [Thermodesulfobacteriota bacterium]|nr:YajQ family cyclic di-GMP-binding protein [Thermodesulfobacteriota bacterium]